MRKAFVFYQSFAVSVRALSQEDRNKVLNAIVDFGIFEETPELEGVALAVFEAIKPSLISQKENYDNGMKGAKYGKLGGRPKKVQEEAPTEEKPKKEKPAKGDDPKLSYGEYGNVKLTAAEYDKLIAKYGSDETQAAIEFFDQYITEKGYKSKSHYLAMCRWVFDAVTERKAKKTTAINTDDCAFDKLFKEAGLMA